MRPILIAGPTASGKSGLALALAEELGGAVVNADALQVYADWRVLTARPPAQDCARAAHLLYGHVDGAAGDYSVGRWLAELKDALAQLSAGGLRPIIVGGTGLYFKAATEGLAEIPPTPPEIRAGLEARLAENGLSALASELSARDPLTADRIALDNPRRVLRAWEALETTGLGLAEWAARTPPPLIPPESAVRLRLAPDRDALYADCARRFDQMLGEGALEEAEAARRRALPAEAPAMKALGAAALIGHLEGRLSLAEARDDAVSATRRYAKRQLTWGRNQMGDWRVLEAPDLAAAQKAIAAFP